MVNAKLMGQAIGSDLSSGVGALPLSVEVIGTAAIEKIELLAAGHKVNSWEGVLMRIGPKI